MTNADITKWRTTATAIMGDPVAADPAIVEQAKEDAEASRVEPDKNWDNASTFTAANSQVLRRYSSFEETLTVSSETTSLASSLLRGHIDNGRQYSSLRDDYWSPVDEKQFENMDLGHLVYLLIESDKDNALFRAPLENPKRILDVGTGPGTWAVDCADKFAEADVYGVDLFPPRHTWMPPNCHLEIEDVTQEWTWPSKFDLIHLRYMLGALTDPEWADLYKKIYDNLEPGGWIEQLEPDARVMCDDDTLDPKSNIAAWGENFIGCSERAGRSITIQTTMKTSIERAGFVNVHDELFKTPIGAWPKDKRLKEAGRVNLEHWSGGLEGFALFLLTRFGAPKPWTQDEVMSYTGKVREELKKPMHIYHFGRRIWAQKPES